MAWNPLAVPMSRGCLSLELFVTITFPLPDLARSRDISRGDPDPLIQGINVRKIEIQSLTAASQNQEAENHWSSKPVRLIQINVLLMVPKFTCSDQRWLSLEA